MSYIGRGLQAGAFRQLDDISSGFDGSDTTHTMQVNSQNVTVGDVNQIILSLGGVIQKPGTDFTVSGSVLTFTTAPAANTNFFAVLLGSDNGGTITPTDASVTVSKLAIAGGEVKLDADGDTSITADTDDQIDFKAGGTDVMSMTATGLTINDGTTITTADNTDTLTLTSTDADANAGPNLRLYRNTSSPADDDLTGQIDFEGRNDNSQDVVYSQIIARTSDVSDGSEDGAFVINIMDDGTLRERMGMDIVATVFNDASQDIDFRVESDSYPRMFQVDAGHNEVQVTDGSSFYDTDSRFSIRTTTSNTRAVHISTSDGSYTQHLARFTLEPEESSSAFFEIMSDYNDYQISFRGDGNGFFDGAADAGNADFAEYFESTDGSAIAIGKTVVLDNGKVRASTDSDNAADIVGVVRHRKTVGIIGNSAWSKWKGKYKVDDYGVPLRENYTLTKWVETYTEDKKDCTITYNGNTQTFDKIKGEKREHSYQTDKIPSEVTAPSDATVVDVDNDGNKLTRKIFSDSYDASKEYVSREDRDEWNLIGLTGQVTMTKGQKTGDRWIKMRDISDTVEEWLVR